MGCKQYALHDISRTRLPTIYATRKTSRAERVDVSSSGTNPFFYPKCVRTSPWARALNFTFEISLKTTDCIVRNRFCVFQKYSGYSSRSIRPGTSALVKARYDFNLRPWTPQMQESTRSCARLSRPIRCTAVCRKLSEVMQRAMAIKKKLQNLAESIAWYSWQDTNHSCGCKHSLRTKS